MLGPKAYAFPVGERLKTTPRHKHLATQANEIEHWFVYQLPPPESMRKRTRACFHYCFFRFHCYADYDSAEACLIMLILFILDPSLKRIPAFNMGGEGWQKKRTVTKIDGVNQYTKR